MELRHLRYFVTIAEEGSFIRAAERLQMSQPPLSQQIQNLEAELDFKLFDRSKRHVQLTEAGHLFLEKAYVILKQVELAIEEARIISRGEIGRLEIGYINTTFYGIPREILKLFRVSYPKVELVLRELMTAEQLQALQNFEIDLGFAIMPVEDEKLASEIVFRDKFMAVLPENHELAGEPFIKVEALANEFFVMHPHKIKSIYYDIVQQICRQAGFIPKVSQEVIQIHTAVHMVASGMGVALVPESAKSINISGVVFKPIYPQSPPLDLGAVWRKVDHSPVLAAFLAVVREIKHKESKLSSLVM